MSNPMPNLQRLANAIEHTLLTAEAGPDEIDRLCREAAKHLFCGVCVNPVYVARAAERLAETAVRVVTVCGFPLGASHRAIKAAEAAQAVRDGAAEVDMVVWVGGLLAGGYDVVREEIAGVVEAAKSVRAETKVKVILETAVLPETTIIKGCEAAQAAGADFVKTSTGFHKTGGATIQAVQLLRRHAGPMGVKAAGGIRDLVTALAMIQAGADRIGTSSGVKIVEELARQQQRQ